MRQVACILHFLEVANVVDENDLLNAGLVKRQLGARAGMLDQSVIPEDLSAVADVYGFHVCLLMHSIQRK